MQLKGCIGFCSFRDCERFMESSLQCLYSHEDDRIHSVKIAECETTIPFYCNIYLAKFNVTSIRFPYPLSTQ